MIGELKVLYLRICLNFTHYSSQFFVNFFFLQVIAEVIGTYMLIFAGCGSVVVNKIYGSVTFPGICVVWGLIVMVLIYSLGHISGAHFNPAVTITHSIFRRFPLKQAGFQIHTIILSLQEIIYIQYIQYSTMWVSVSKIITLSSSPITHSLPPLSNIHHFCPFQLFQLEKKIKKFLPYLSGQDLLGFINGSNSCPLSTICFNYANVS